ncbi:MAG: glycogen synthase GlgA [Atopostipes suicloacalis]|nr:glycogen synthase GlgA [Atopostipes suicloacalis]
MKLLFAATECAPFFKSGGLGDVIGALPKELAKKGHEVRVILPYFKKMMPKSFKKELTDLDQFEVELSWRKQYVGIKTLKEEGVRYYFIDNEYYFNRDQLYGYGDDAERFAYFQLAAIEMMEVIDYIPDIFHVNDWQTAVIPVLLKDKYSWKKRLKKIKTVLTIHNLMFQGIYDQYVLGDLFGIGYAAFHDRGLKGKGEAVNFLKGGIYYADLVTTVSPNYAKEIQTKEFGMGLDEDLRAINYKLVGLLNGIDYDHYDPAYDQTIPATFTAKDLEGKKLNKLALQEKVGLPPSETTALIGIVSRLDEQKGIQLMIDSLHELLSFRNVQVILLGTGKEYYEEAFRQFNYYHPNEFKAMIEFDVDLAQLIYAGSDLFLMPSAFEPCGLSQMNAMRYGTLPIVHETGGLADTVEAYNHETAEGTGFSFYDFDAETLLNTIDHALTIYYDFPKQWKKLIQQAMAEENSWEQAAEVYLEEYDRLLN